MPTLLCDTRTLGDLDDCKQALAEIRELVCRREIIVARAERAIQKISRAATEQAEELDAKIRPLEDALRAFIMANRAAFASPRSVATADGKFGLRKATGKLDVTDLDMAIEAILDRGYDDCIEIKRRLVPAAIRRRMLDGEQFPGIELSGGELAFYEVARTLVHSAVQRALGTETEA